MCGETTVWKGRLGGSFTKVSMVLPTGFGKSFILQLLVLLEKTASVLVFYPLTSIISDQIFEEESMGLFACNLSEKLADLT